MRTTQINFFDVKVGQMFYFRNFSGVCVKRNSHNFVNNNVVYYVDNVKALCIVYTLV